MATRRTGQYVNFLGSILRNTTSSDVLSNIAISSELLPSTALSDSYAVLNQETQTISLPTSFIRNLYSLYQYDVYTNNWVMYNNYSIVYNKLVIPDNFNSLMIAIPQSLFTTSFKEDGEYVYTFYTVKNDARVYRNFIVTSSSYNVSPYISMQFAATYNGPWGLYLDSYFVPRRFCIKIIVHGTDQLLTSKIIPTEMISINCLVCR